MTLRARPALAAAIAALIFCSCSGGNSATVWTDTPVVALYAAAFNESQTRFKIEVQYRESIATSLSGEKAHPALVIGSYLRNSDTRRHFQPIDYLFGEMIIDKSAFYPNLLSIGNVEGRQLFLPVSFNMPLVLFRKDVPKPEWNNFVVSPEELRKAGAGFNERGKQGFAKMAYSPRWDEETLVLLARMYGADLREGKPFAWSDSGFDRTLDSVRAWSKDNGGPADEDDFKFKYLYMPRHKSVEDGRVMFAVMDSSEYFLISEERRMPFDFRWLALDEAIPIDEGIVYAAMCRSGRGKQAAEAFLKWLYREETQRSLLETAKKNRSAESVFGIAGGFSSIRSVNEKTLPLFYPSLLGHVPPENYLKAPGSLPRDWLTVRSRIVAPFLFEATGANPPPDAHADFRSRVDTWIKQGGG